MSAQPLPWWALVAALGVTGWAAWRLAGRERGGFIVTGSTVVAQLGLHALFGLAQSYQADGFTVMADMPATSAAHMAYMGAMHHDMGQMQVMHSGHSTLGMFLAHTLAALLCGLWMWRGEAAAFRLARSAAATLFAPLLLVLTALGWTGLKPTVRAVAGAGHVLCQAVAEHRQPSGLPGFDDGLALRELLDALDGERRQAFVLTQLVGMPYADAAAVVGCPVGTVRSRVARARADLIRWLRSAETCARVPQVVAA